MTFVRFERTTYWPSVSPRNHHTEEPTVSGRHRKVKDGNLQQSQPIQVNSLVVVRQNVSMTSFFTDFTLTGIMKIF